MELRGKCVSYSVPSFCWSVWSKNHIPGEMTICLMLSLFCPPLSLSSPTCPCFPLVLWLCQLFLTLFSPSLLYCISHSLSVKLVFTLPMFSFCSHYGLNPPSLTPLLCSSSWRLQLCSSLLLAFLVRYRYSFSTLFVSPLLYEHNFLGF